MADFAGWPVEWESVFCAVYKNKYRTAAKKARNHTQTAAVQK